ncbi:DUF2651 family protein [Bacillus sp. A31]|uniref:DUF2651 family protein n=1 Tax=Bacillus sp. A31 TaxID=3102787 RepID=UPI0039B48190
MTHLEFVFGLLPVSIIIVSFIVTLFVQKVYFMPVVSFIILLILTFTLFNVSFLGVGSCLHFWLIPCFIYSIIHHENFK